MKKKTVFYLLLVLLLGWMLIIFLFSAQPADESSSLSGGVGRKVASIVVPGFQKWDEVKQEQYVTGIDFFVRKTAHFTEYMILGMLWMLCLQNKPDKSDRLRSAEAKWTIRTVMLRQNIAISVCGSAVYAMSDEFHQLFVDGRAGRWMDVGIDTLGAVVGVILAALGIKFASFLRQK